MGKRKKQSHRKKKERKKERGRAVLVRLFGLKATPVYTYDF